MEQFFLNSLISGIGLSIYSAPFGCFILWRRMAFFSDALSHSVLVGLFTGFLLHIDQTYSFIAFAIIFAYLFNFIESKYSNDTILSIMSQGFLALGLVLIGLQKNLKIDLMSYLFGDILAVSQRDLLVIYLMGALSLIWLFWNWKNILLYSINEDLAAVNKVKVKNIKLQLTIITAILIAIAIKIIGIMLITGMLIIPAATAKLFSKTPLQMLAYAIILSIFTSVIGLLISFHVDIASGPAIILFAISIFYLSHLISYAIKN